MMNYHFPCSSEEMAMMEDYKGGRLRRQLNEREIGFAWGALCFTCSLLFPFEHFSPAFWDVSVSRGPPLASLIKLLCPSEACSSSSGSANMQVQVPTLVFCWWPSPLLPGGSLPLRALSLLVSANQSRGPCPSLQSVHPDTCWRLPTRCARTMSRTSFLWAEGFYFEMWWNEVTHPKGISWENKRYIYKRKKASDKE